MNSNSMRAARSAAADVRRQLRYAARTNSRFAVEGNSLRIASEQTQNPSTASVHGTANLNAGFAAPSPAFAPSFRSYSSAVPTESEWIEKIVQQAALQHDVDANLVRAIIKVESNFNPRAVSRKGAIGLMQLMPGTAKSLNVTNPYDPAQNVDAGVRHFKELLESYDGNLELSLAAYNAGVGAVHRSRGIPNYSETRKYVRRITGIYGSKTARLNTSSHPLVLRRDAEGHLSVSNME
jgi:soluble lytic murein transglycosylase-like protein